MMRMMKDSTAHGRKAMPSPDRGADTTNHAAHHPPE
jgi:hypothetical protein